LPIEPAIARTIWEIKYRRRRADGEAERSPAETWARVAAALAVPEGGASAAWEKKFRRLLHSGRFLPGGRILAGAGTADPVTLFNCFVLPAPADATFARTLREAEATMRQGGGIGFDMSLTEPGTPGVVARLQQLDAMCETLVAHGARRGAMMAALRCDHPEIVEFIEAKAQAGALRNFNLSAQVTDRFLAAVRADGPWPLVFPEGGPARAGTSARQLWERLLRST
jgi:ribonucleoside-diphosphate reductase alpha chain